MDHAITLKDLVLEEPETARVFQELGIDYCCHGTVTVSDACAQKGLDPNRVWKALEHAHDHGPAHDHDDPRELTTPALIARIIDRHHFYMRRVLPSIAPLMSTVARVHGERDHSLIDLERAFLALKEMLEPHIEEEERDLFPVLTAPVLDTARVHRELRRMVDDHLAVGATLARIRSLTNNFTLPQWACTSTRALWRDLILLETDLMQHMHTENHVLAPRFGEVSAAA